MGGVFASLVKHKNPSRIDGLAFSHILATMSLVLDSELLSGTAAPPSQANPWWPAMIAPNFRGFFILLVKNGG